MCIWKSDNEADAWETECGHAFCVTTGSPLENEMRFCCFCGEALIEEIATEEEDDELS